MRILTASALTLASLTFVACGDDGGDGDGALSKSEYIEQADVVCKRLDDEGSDLEAPTSEDEVAGFLEELLVLGREAEEASPPWSRPTTAVTCTTRCSASSAS